MSWSSPRSTPTSIKSSSVPPACFHARPIVNPSSGPAYRCATKPSHVIFFLFLRLPGKVFQGPGLMTNALRTSCFIHWSSCSYSSTSFRFIPFFFTSSSSMSCKASFRGNWGHPSRSSTRETTKSRVFHLQLTLFPPDGTVQGLCELTHWDDRLDAGVIGNHCSFWGH